METTAQQVVDLFRSSPRALGAFDAWRCAPERSGVPEIALAHISNGAYSVTARQVEELRDEILEDSKRNFPRNGSQMGRRDPRALHPLATIRPYKAKDNRAKNWSAPMSFNLAFHTLLERREGRLFSYPEFRAACQTQEPLRSLLWVSAEQLHQQVATASSLTSTATFLDAMHWRVGCAYYAFLKELYILARVRDAGFELLMHPLADTLFRTDFWTSSGSALSIYVPNDEFAADNVDKGRDEPRKFSMAEFLPMMFHSQHRIELPIPHTFGTVDVPPDEVIEDICNRLRKDADASIPVASPRCID